jgi:hypothetical protein
VVYYSKYGWQTNAAVWLENATADTDYLNVDTDELKLIEYKAQELGEIQLRSGLAKESFQLYEQKKKEYQMKYPSESLIMTTKYQFT